MQIETTETTINDLSEAPCEPAPMTEGQPLQPRMVVFKAPAQARRNWPGLVQHEESPCPAAPPDREPLAGMPQAETLVHSSMAASTGTVSQAGMDFSASVEGRWLELPPDPTYERSIEAEREAWAEEMRERQHEQKLANEQRGDLWSA